MRQPSYQTASEPNITSLCAGEVSCRAPHALWRLNNEIDACRGDDNGKTLLLWDAAGDNWHGGWIRGREWWGAGLRARCTTDARVPTDAALSHTCLLKRLIRISLYERASCHLKPGSFPGPWQPFIAPLYHDSVVGPANCGQLLRCLPVESCTHHGGWIQRNYDNLCSHQQVADKLNKNIKMLNIEPKKV